MNWKSWLVLFLIGIGLLCTSCAGEETQNATLVGVEEAAISDDEESVGSSEVEASEEEVVIEPEPTAEPTATLAPTATPRSILMQDDFSDIRSGWERYREFDGVLDYVEDEEHYQMLVQAADSLWWVWLEEELPDVTLSAEVWQVDGPEGSLFGVMCRHDVETRQGIAFLINTQGQAGVGLMKNGFELLPGGELTEFDAILAGLNARNSIEATCQGEKLMMWVNGSLLFDLSVEEALGESIGFVLATPAGAGADVRFDNLKVYAP